MAARLQRFTASEFNESWSQGANVALEIESENHNKTLLRFRSALPPEMVDGVVVD